VYIRFVVHRRNEDSGRRDGLIQAAWDLLESNTLSDFEREQFNDILCWFGKYLRVPDRFARRDHSQAHPEAICWLKASAVDHVSWMRELGRVLGEHDIVTEMIAVERPGYIVYEDDHQVAAVPFAETVT
jgi:hypothetical protein